MLKHYTDETIPTKAEAEAVAVAEVGKEAVEAGRAGGGRPKKAQPKKDKDKASTKAKGKDKDKDKDKAKSKSKLKKTDPKGFFEVERHWRACKTDADRQAYAAKILRPDGAVATALFGDRSTATAEADVLTDLVIARISLASEPREISKALEALGLVVGASRFNFSAMMLSNAQQAEIGTCLDELQGRITSLGTKPEEVTRHRGQIGVLKAAFHCG